MKEDGQWRMGNDITGRKKKGEEEEGVTELR